MKKLAAIGILLFLFGFTAHAQTARGLFNQRCAVCHITKKPTLEQRKNLIAPPIFGVMRHVKERYKTKNGAVNFIVEYALNPSKNSSVCLPETIKKFGVMPSQKGILTKEDIRKIAEYMYDNFPPKGMKYPKKEPGLSNDNKTDGKTSGEVLVKKYGCLACHNVYGPKQAPGFAGIAKKAKMSSNATKYISNAIKNGSKGKYPKFANMVMPPFSSIGDSDRIKIAKWILSLRRKGGRMGRQRPKYQKPQ